jgi:hypothetical protein
VSYNSRISESLLPLQGHADTKAHITFDYPVPGLTMTLGMRVQFETE